MIAATNFTQRFDVGTTMPLPLRPSPTSRGSCPGWKLRRLLLVVSAGVLFNGVLGHDAAAAGQQHELLKQLQEKLDQRDAIILDLQKRVALLERRGNAESEAPPQAKAEAPKAEAPVATKSAPSGPTEARPETPVTKTAMANRNGTSTALEVDEEAAQRALERQLNLTGALLVPYKVLQIQPYFTYSRVERDFPTFITQNGFLIGVGNQRFTQNQYLSGVFGRLGLPFDSQLELNLPYQVVDQSVVTPAVPSANETDHTASSFGDVSVGVAKTLYRERGWLPDFVGRVTWTAPTGRWSSGNVLLGNGFNRVNGSLTFLKRQDPLAFSGTFFYQASFQENGINPGDQYGVTLGTFLAASPETSLGMQIQQTFFTGFEIDGDSVLGNTTAALGKNQANSSIILSANTRVSRTGFFNLSGAIGLTSGAPNYYVNASIPINFDLPF
ncbi:MAG: hypothetical protein AB1648_00815 [Pseudomonadota bacterium]